jgi:hypothetical protein
MNSDIRLFQLNSYVRPKIVEVPSKDWVLNGRRNEFYQDIIDAYNGSPTNTSIINSFVELCYGNGLVDKSGNTMNWVTLVSILKPNELKKIFYDFCLFGEASIQVIKTKGKKLSEIAHIPKQLVVPNKVNEDGEIEMYWYCEDWSNTLKNIPVSYPAFGTSNEAIEIYCIKPYKAGKKYFSDPDWLPIISYCQIEEEIANFYIKSIKQGLSAGYIINIPDGNSLSPEEKTEFERQIRAKLTGSPNAMNFVLSFNGRDAEITIVPFPVNEQMHKQWEFLTAETTQKILTGHRCTSPSLVGIISSSGFSNTADEMDMAEKQLMKRVIQPKQNYIIDALDDILEAYDINLDLSFKPLTEEIIAPNKTELSTHVCFSKDEDEFATKEAAEKLIALGEDLDDSKWSLIDNRQSENITLNENTLNKIFQFAVSTPTDSDPKTSESIQDTSLFKVRYQYAGSLFPERTFCKIMMAANKFYKAEDLDKDQMTTPKMGAGGSNTYNPFLYKGGVNCRHWWQRQIFLKTDNQQISVNNAVKMILELEPSERLDAKWDANPKEVAVIASPSNNNWKVN